MTTKTRQTDFMAAIVRLFHAALARRAWLRGALATLAGCAWVDAKQRERAYRPTPGRPADFAGLRADDRMVTLAVPGASATQTDRLRPWRLPNPNPQAPTLLHLHGTFRNPFRNHRKIDAPIRMMHGSADRPVPFALSRGLSRPRRPARTGCRSGAARTATRPSSSRSATAKRCASRSVGCPCERPRDLAVRRFGPARQSVDHGAARGSA